MSNHDKLIDNTQPISHFQNEMMHFRCVSHILAMLATSMAIQGEAITNAMNPDRITDAAFLSMLIAIFGLLPISLESLVASIQECVNTHQARSNTTHIR